MQQSLSPATRRNGKPQSCEPCRKRKLKCDHTRPVCRRCFAKGIPGECFYHPAPMTKRGAEGRESPAAVASRSRSRARPDAASSSATLGSGRLHGSDVAVATFESSSALPGYLGSTSYSAVLAEHRSDIPVDTENEPESAAATRLLDSLDPGRIQSGVEVLGLLYNFTICDTLVRQYYERSLVAIMPHRIIDSVIRSIRRVFTGFDAHDTERRLRDLTIQVFHNSSRPLVTRSSMTVGEYCSLFTGENSRWEAIGSIFAISGMSLMATPDSDPVLTQGNIVHTKDKLLAQIAEASNICLTFCDQAASANELLAFLQYNDVMRRTQQYGDSSYQAWRRLGDLSATVYAAGLHQESGPADDCPYFLRQWRRSCFASAFYADKCIATFVGRPPLINYRYCTLTPPLDLSDDALIADGDTLNRALAELDASGWNTHGKRHRATVTRLRFLLAIFREEALEVALGTAQGDLKQKSSRILEKAKATWDACPDHLRYDRYVRPIGEAFNASFYNLLLYLDYLYTCFLLQRTLVKQTDTGQELLFDTSRKLLSTVIKISAERDPLQDLRRDYSWLTLYYGLPSASVLALELLRQTQQAGPHILVLPRAELIRNLSVFISCLSWVAQPNHGNYRICKEAEKKLSHIVDRILDPQPVQGQSPGFFNDATSGLDSLLDWYNYSTWDFNSDIFGL